MSIETWIYYTIAILILTASPGPSVLLCITKSVTQSFKLSIYTALGSLSAIVIIMSLSFSGLGLIIASSQIVFTLIKYLGAAYLIYLGYKAFTSKQEDYTFETKKKNYSKKDIVSSYISGFLVGASNPKALVFFIALFPQFINTQDSLLLQYLVFVGTFCILELSWLLFYAYLGSRSSSWLLQKGRAKLFNKITGGVFISAGIFLSSTNKNL